MKRTTRNKLLDRFLFTLGKIYLESRGNLSAVKGYPRQVLGRKAHPDGSFMNSGWQTPCFVYNRPTNLRNLMISGG